MGKRAWLKLIAENRRTIFRLAKESVSTYRGAKKRESRASEVIANEQ
jgi:hypothetical protein